MNPVASKATQYMPIRVSMCYLLGTFILFLTSNIFADTPNPVYLTAFVLLAFAALWGGYVLGVRTCAKRWICVKDMTPRERRRINLFVLIGSCYAIVWGVNQIIDYGGTDPIQVLDAIINPGTAYSAKFEVFERRELNQEVNRITQILILLSVIYAMFFPGIVLHWRRLGRRVKVFSLIATAVYILSYLFIGTQKGLGDVLIFALAGWSVKRALSQGTSPQRLNGRNILAIALVGSIAFIYMAANQASRAAEFGLTTTLLAGDVSKTYLAEIFGSSFALGIYSLIGYPSHGYFGLSQSLTADFVFSYGAGLSQAFESYRYQYFGGPQNLLLTYPFRAELLTGWPAGMYWSTAFPWFASDLTFPGVLVLMLLLGFVFARVWLSSLRHMDLASLAALGQFFLFIAFLPANNQVLMQRQGFWVVLTLLALFMLRRVRPR
ncbi:hypothetical protein [Variovorax paradoxus]|uniref:hypothetical protein n=1 Tax=Variovorax paradoxus TaxID=34073 RepID=UPI000A58ABE5|nr:hypothetical protein [Variovorax paradoxus]